MQVNSISFKGLDNDYENFSNDMHKSLNAVRDLRKEFFAEPDDTFEKEETPEKKNALGILGSLAFIAGASFLATRKAYKLTGSFMEGVKNLPQTSKVVGNIAESKVVKQISESINASKNKIATTLTNVCNAVNEKVPNFIKNSKLVKLYSELQPATKVGMLGATVGTVAASRVDGNENGCSDMFEKGISVLDSVANKAGRVVKIAEALS